MLLQANSKILILAPHTDDGEFGCGGTIAKLIKQGAQVYYAAFSACEQSVLPQFPKDILITELKAATRVLGIPNENLFLFSFQVRTFNYRRQDILDKMVELRQQINPDVVFMPSQNDIHQDHQTIVQEGLRAFKFSTILCYEMPWNNLNFNTCCFVHLTDEDVETKSKALAEYKSQQHRPYANDEFIRALARTRGVQINTHYAETFEVLRWIIS
ncbi:PIG-L deacetylase family protein [Tellurirhabdus bombi]|uniref:PIG-L deacetylase family protein n=1 Tax=Tellurirhabdus bombi TaxID=2907205 RepID=UPI001F28F627|nr:PIG-L deacetylase family protein [Tellurirhabdus bombi]